MIWWGNLVVAGMLVGSLVLIIVEMIKEERDNYK